MPEMIATKHTNPSISIYTISDKKTTQQLAYLLSGQRFLGTNKNKQAKANLLWSVYICLFLSLNFLFLYTYTHRYVFFVMVPAEIANK